MTFVPALAFSHETTLSSMLALSALHLQTLLPNDKHIQYAKSYYFTRTISLYRRGLADISKDNAESLLVTALLISHFTWLEPASLANSVAGPCDLIDSAGGGAGSTGSAASGAGSAAEMSVADTYELPLQSYILCNGIYPLFHRLRPFLEQQMSVYRSIQFFSTQYKPMVNRWALIASTADDGIQDSPFVVGMIADLDRVLAGIDSDGTTTEAAAKLFYTLATTLVSMARAIAAPTTTPGYQQSIDHITRTIPFLPIMVSRHYLELLRLNDPRALALLARNFALMACLKRKWWVHGCDGGEEEYSHITALAMRRAGEGGDVDTGRFRQSEAENSGGEQGGRVGNGERNSERNFENVRRRGGLPEWHVNGLSGLIGEGDRWMMMWPVAVIEGIIPLRNVHDISSRAEEDQGQTM
jgi:hypothetical protein